MKSSSRRRLRIFNRVAADRAFSVFLLLTCYIYRIGIIFGKKNRVQGDATQCGDLYQHQQQDERWRILTAIWSSCLSLKMLMKGSLFMNYIKVRNVQRRYIVVLIVCRFDAGHFFCLYEKWFFFTDDEKIWLWETNEVLWSFEIFFSTEFHFVFGYVEQKYDWGKFRFRFWVTMIFS